VIPKKELIERALPGLPYRKHNASAKSKISRKTKKKRKLIRNFFSDDCG